MKKAVMEKYPYLNTPDFVIKNQKYYFKKGITWSTITTSKNSFRYCKNGFIPETKGSICYPHEEGLQFYIIGLLNSIVTEKFVQVLSPTLDLHEGPLGRIPFIFDETYLDEINSLSKRSIQLVKEDWDEYETSWDFLRCPLLNYTSSLLSKNFEYYYENKMNNFYELKNNELELNKIFLEIYKLNFDSKIEDKYVSIEKADYNISVKSFISYAVGCMFGRYSLDEEGLQFAGGEFDIKNYSKFIPDDDNIIPVLDTEYFNDDIVGRFVDFVKTCFGEETLEENLDFIAGALKKKGNTSREIIRNYFLTDFFKDHVQTYKKCPIYWQFDSGKQNGFKCLIYMHRYDPSLVARVRTDYLHKTQKAIEQNIIRCDNILSNTSSASEKSKVTKEKNKLVKQLAETREYDEALAYMANQNIEIDLDDGVKVNYAKFQKVEVSKEGQKTKKINLLKKI